MAGNRRAPDRHRPAIETGRKACVAMANPALPVQKLKGVYRMDRDLFTAAYVPKWGEQLESLADLAMKEPWRFRNPAFPRKHADYVILEKYINGIFTAQVMAYQRAISQQEADARFFIRSGYACFHTGLLTKRYKDIFGYLERNRNDWADQAYVLRGFVDDSQPFLKKVDLLPQNPLADIRAEEFGFRPDWPIRVNVGHILDDSANLERIPEPARSFPNLPLLLQTGVEIARKTAEFIPSMVVPQLYGGAIQHLLPICLNDPNKPDLAMTISRMEGFYAGNTCLTLEMAYSNARLLAVPTAPWLAELVE